LRIDSGAGGSLNCSSDEDLAAAPRVALTVSTPSAFALSLRYIGPDCQPVVAHVFTFPGEIHEMESFEGAWFDVQDDLGAVVTVWQVPDGVDGSYDRVIP